LRFKGYSTHEDVENLHDKEQMEPIGQALVMEILVILERLLESLIFPRPINEKDVN
jgi:hypothetical protein